jgi:peptidoglycan hydrolase-like protein with peptidoglycan-binding domain
MSDPSTLLLSVCVACTSGAEHSIQVELPSCASSVPQRAAGLKRNVPKCISLPEAIAPAPRAVSPPTRAISPPSQRSFYPMARLATQVGSPELMAIRAADGDRASFSPSSADMSSLRQGSRGEMVRALQIRLRRLGYYSGAIDGIYGPQTHAAVLKFQQIEDPTADATVDAASQTDWQQHSLVQDLAPRDLAPSDLAPRDLAPRDLASDGSVASRSATNINAIRQELQQTTIQKREAFSQESFLTSDASAPEQGDRTPSESTETAPANSVKQRVVWEPFSTDPSSTTFYLWLLGWAVVYIGGFVVIFLTSDSQLKQRWLAKRSPQHYQGTTPPMVDLEDVIDRQDAIDQEEGVDNLQDSGVSEQPPHKTATPSVVDISVVDIPVPPSLPSVPTNTASTNTVPSNTASTNTVASPKDEADRGAIATSDPIDEELPVYWADEVLPQIATALVDIENLFDELSAELNARDTTGDSNQPSVMEAAAEPSPVQPSPAQPTEGATPSTIIGILSASESNSDITYTYHLLDDANGSFVLRENELRIKDDVLHAIQTDTSFAVKVRRIDSNGQQLDESFTLHLGMPDLSEANEESDELIPIA